MQVWQMLGIMAKSCSIDIRQSEYQVRTAICHGKPWTTWEEYEQQLLPELQRCPWVEPPSFDVGYDTTSNRTLLQDLLTGDVTQAYETMSRLVGLFS